MSQVKAKVRNKSARRRKANVQSMTTGEVAGNIVKLVKGHTFRTMVTRVSIFPRGITLHPVNAGSGTLKVLLANNPHRANAANFAHRSLREHGLFSTLMTSPIRYTSTLMTNDSRAS